MSRHDHRHLGPAFCVMALLLAGCGRSQAPAAVPPPEVEVAPVEQRDVPIYREWVATLDGSVNAQIQARVTGYLLTQNFPEGSFVRRNEVLFEIDPRPLQAALDQARAQLAESEANESRAKAQVAQNEANERKAARDVERDTPLAEARAIPRSQLETNIQAHHAAVAAVEAAKAQVHQAVAAVEAHGLRCGKPSWTWDSPRSVR
jgi:multidrug efflux pump subunit AcrA (membrane-fusion protein)